MTATSSSTAPGIGSAEADEAAKPVTVITQIRVLPERSADFAAWMPQLNDAVAKAPGFIDSKEIPPSPPSQLDWVIIQRFQTSQQAQSWLRSPERLRLIAIAQPMLVGDVDIHIVQEDAAAPTEAVSAVISMQITPGQEQAFRQWSQHIAAAQAQFPGSQGFKLSPPIPGVQDDWMTIVQFDNESHLNAWMQSPERQKLLDEANAFTKESHYRIVRTGFDQWFRFEGAAHAPAWKQNMLVLLGLYPTVFLFGFFVGTPLISQALGWPFWLALFAGNIASVTVLNWLVPWISRRFGWWLQPAGSETRERTLQGIAIVVGLYALLLLLFWRFPPEFSWFS
jgi:antibiotic biosynthesis monooxygenase (ABM) superfamily enzyme